MEISHGLLQFLMEQMNCLYFDVICAVIVKTKVICGAICNIKWRTNSHAFSTKLFLFIKRYDELVTNNMVINTIQLVITMTDKHSARFFLVFEITV